MRKRKVEQASYYVPASGPSFTVFGARIIPVVTLAIATLNSCGPLARGVAVELEKGALHAARLTPKQVEEAFPKAKAKASDMVVLRSAARFPTLVSAAVVMQAGHRKFGDEMTEWMSPWHPFLVDDSSSLIFFTVTRGDVQYRGNTTIEPWVPAPCFRISLTSDEFRSVQQPDGFGGSFVSMGAEEFVGGAPMIATRTFVAIGYDNKECAKAMEDKVTDDADRAKWSAKNIAKEASTAPPPAFILHYGSHAAISQWARELRKSPEVGLAVLSSSRAFLLLRNPENRHTLAVIPLQRVRGDRSGHTLSSWLKGCSKDVHMFKASASPWLFRLSER